MTLYIQEEFTPRMVNRIIQAYEMKKKKRDTLNIYLTSPGGQIYSEQVLETFMNERAQDITLTAVGISYSAAFHLLLNFVGTKSVMAQTQGLIHLPRAEVTTTSNGQIADYQDDMSIWIKDKKNTQQYLSCYKPVLTDTEFKDMKAGKDLWIPHSRLIQILKKQNEILNNQ